MLKASLLCIVQGDKQADGGLFVCSMLRAIFCVYVKAICLSEKTFLAVFFVMTEQWHFWCIYVMAKQCPLFGNCFGTPKLNSSDQCIFEFQP